MTCQSPPPPPRIMWHWQSVMYNEMTRERINASLIWVYDRHGGTGKTSLAHTIRSRNGACTVAGTTRDMDYFVKPAPHKTIAVADLTGNGERCLDDLHLASGGSADHILVLANQLPPLTRVARHWRVFAIEPMADDTHVMLDITATMFA